MNCLSKLITFFIILVAFIVGLVFLGQYLLNRYVPEMVNDWASEETGFDFDLDFFKLSLLDSSFSIKDFDISNPEGWKDSDFFTMNEATCDFSLKNSTKERLYFDRLALDVKELALVIDENGNANWSELMNKFKSEKDQGETKTEKKATEEDTVVEDSEETQKLPSLFIKELVLGLDKIEIVDYSRTPTWKRTYSLGMHIELKDVDSIDDLVEPLINQLISSGATSAIPVIYGALGNNSSEKKTEKPNPLELLNGLLGK
jgi:hypothetical protein